jgi:phosphohistidine phosphatase
MHQLHLIRHAKAAAADSVDDRDRPLSRRGRDAARRVGESLPAALGPVDLVLCSTALRTRETAALVLTGFAVPPRVLFDDALYLAGAVALIQRLRRLDEACGTVLLIGHNPGLHDLAVSVAATDSPRYRALAEGKFPTTARASFAVACSWTDLNRSRHALLDYATPKSLGAED